MTPTERQKLWLAALLVALFIGVMAVASGAVRARSVESGYRIELHDASGRTWASASVSLSHLPRLSITSERQRAR